MSEHDPIRAQDHLAASVKFAADSKMSVNSPRENFSVENLELQGLPGVREIVDGNLHLKPNQGLSMSADNVKLNPTTDEDGLTEGESIAVVSGMPGRYEAHIAHAGGTVVSAVDAKVTRGGSEHRFSPQHAEKAAALITSLAAKRLGSRVIKHTDTVAAAREAFDRKTA